jgi:hypothetical protein
MSEAMNLQAADLEKLGNLKLMQSLLINMQTNIYLIEQGATGQVITVNNANLYQLAAQYYGDATKWTAIAQANALTDPMVQATITIQVVSLFLTIAGFVQPSQLVEVALTVETGGAPITTYYRYAVKDTDTINLVVLNLAAQIPGATVALNVIKLPAYISISTNVSRFVQLTIPQSAADQGGILQS